MGLLDRVRAWWRRRSWAGRGGDAGAGGTGADAATDFTCAVCGTGVESPDGQCPLCRSTDVVPADAAAGPDGDAGAASGTQDRRHVAPGDDESVDRLRDLRGDAELLERHSDRWRPVDGGFRVETSDGTRAVDSRAEVVALLRAEDD